MNTISQEAVNIGPVPRNICVPESGVMFAAIFCALACTIIWHYALVMQSKKLNNDLKEMINKLKQ